PDSLETFLGTDPGNGPCECRMVRVFDGPRLIAASFFDVGREAASSVYGIFEPEYARRSLGIFTMLLEIQHCRDSGLRWLYPGYATHEPSAYDYKKQFRGTEMLDWSTGEWRPLPP
ncbi:MAG TPA: GNAT family N-acetyltransferase, partial [Prosthecobacter sp.]|nr:GNAT family N-acetyltransferase [Prosthecobacter sp.]